MSGWAYLPRFVDKIRLHLAGKLHPDYQENFCKAFDGAWLKKAGLTAEQFIGVVKETITDGQVADWVAKNVKATEADKAAYRDSVLNYGPQTSPETAARFQMRKEQAGLTARTDIHCFVDIIDADEGRM
jgi:hypothetical protein